MKKLFAFLIKYSIVILFLFLEMFAFSMIVRNNGYQQSVFFSSSNTLLASLYSVSNSVIEYFYLKSTNEGLASENTALKNQVVELQNQLDALHPYIPDTGNIKISPDKEIRFIQAKVINNSTNKLLNFITLNKGTRDGIKPDMGVINEEGVVGVVSTVSEKFAVVIPVINPKIQINSKFLRNNYSGPVHWEGHNFRYANLNDIARHVVFSLGDTIVTSGYSQSFPEGILVGTVDDFKISDSDAYYYIKVKLGVNFRTLTHVKVIDYLNYQEQQNLEKTMQE
ncbi:MAG: rod shape-determining protein MreC [Paludibacter sp.]|nr:rod shape-determining protein MreC [Paludibacter sp.]MDD4198097.1 rod shape-determining protein MreC [Paludibacter sp.]MDD4427679.1 rod shape-determining protein MreC [Paludibacter sp.]